MRRQKKHTLIPSSLSLPLEQEQNTSVPLLAPRTPRAKPTLQPTAGALPTTCARYGNPQCLWPLAGSRLVLSLNAHSPVLHASATPSQGGRTQGNALIEKGRRNRGMSRWEGVGERDHGRRKPNTQGKKVAKLK